MLSGLVLRVLRVLLVLLVLLVLPLTLVPQELRVQQA